jgi:membrane protease YdiL (CAAX protease family)
VPLLIATYALLTLAILSLWMGGDETQRLRRLAWLLPFTLSMLLAWIGGIITAIALVWIGAFAAAASVFGRTTQRWQRGLAAVAIVVLAAGLMTHQLPGFENPRVISGQQFTRDAIPFGLHLNFDKTVVGLFLIGFCLPRIRSWRDAGKMLGRMIPIAAATIAVTMSLALAFGYVRFDPKFPRESWLWLWVNLCFTCLAEEAVFRGFIQHQLAHAWREVRHGAWLALVVAAVLFGVAHVAGGPYYVLLASIAGFGYGLAYLRTGRIEASILTHFALNATHFLGFTYPALLPKS